MPPSPENTLGPDFLLLVMGAVLFALIERVLYPDVCLDFPLRSLEPYQPRDLERVTYLYL